MEHESVHKTVEQFARNYSWALNEAQRKKTDEEVSRFIQDASNIAGLKEPEKFLEHYTNMKRFYLK